MANFAALIAPLSISGSRLSDGSPNSSGTVWFMRPNTNATVDVYTDAEASAIVSQPVTLNEGGRLPSDFPDGIFATQPIRLLIQDVNTNTVTDEVYIPATAGNVGYNPDQDDATFTDSNLNDILQKAQDSFGGTNWNYLIANGQTERPVGDAITEIHYSVKAFGAVGNGVAIDTTAIQNALNFAKAAGGGIVYFPPGTYKIDQALTLTSADGVTVKGSGINSSIISSTHATANAFTFNTCTGLAISNISIRHASTSTGIAISLTTCLRANVTNVHSANAASTDGVYRFGISASGCSDLVVVASYLYAIAADAAGRAIYLLNSPALTTLGGELHADAGFPIEFDGVAGASMFGTIISGSPRFAVGITGLFFSFIGSTLSTPSIAAATIPYIRMVGTSVDASATSSATGAAQTPSLIAGNEVILSATSGGAGTVTVNAPAILPSTGASAGVDLYWDFVFKNAAGGAVTWSLNAVFVVASAIPTTDAHTIAVRFRWDRTTSKLREVSRADTVT